MPCCDKVATTFRVTGPVGRDPGNRSLRQLLGRELVSPRQVLSQAAVLGDRISPELLSRVVGMTPEELAPVLDELEWHRWLVSEPRGYSFLARVVRQVVAQDMLTPGQRQRVLDAAARLGTTNVQPPRA